MLKKLASAGALALVVLATGCASVPMAKPELDTAAKSYSVKPDKANIYVYRNETFGAAIKMPIVLNGKLVDAAAKTFLILEVAPGKHTVISKTENDSTVTLDTATSRNYFLWQEVKMGMLPRARRCSRWMTPPVKRELRNASSSRSRSSGAIGNSADRHAHRVRESRAVLVNDQGEHLTCAANSAGLIGSVVAQSRFDSCVTEAKAKGYRITYEEK